MPAADFAPLPIALLRLVVLPDELLAFGHGDGRGLPQRERVDRARGPAPAVRAMAVARADRVTRHDEPDRTTEALPLERLLALTHDTPSSWSVRSAIRARYRLARTSISRFAQRDRPRARAARAAPGATACGPPAPSSSLAPTRLRVGWSLRLALRPTIPA